MTRDHPGSLKSKEELPQTYRNGEIDRNYWSSSEVSLRHALAGLCASKP